MMGNFTYNGTLNADPIVDKYVSGKRTIYALTIPDQKARTGNYTLNLGHSASAAVYSLKAGSSAVTKTMVKTVSGKLSIKVTETPVFVEGM